MSPFMTFTWCRAFGPQLVPGGLKTQYFKIRAAIE